MPKLLLFALLLSSNSGQIVQGSEEASAYLAVLAQSLEATTVEAQKTKLAPKLAPREQKIMQAIKWLQELNDNEIHRLITQEYLLLKKDRLEVEAIEKQHFDSEEDYPNASNINKEVWDLFQKQIDETWQHKVVPYGQELCSSVLKKATDFLKELNIEETIKNKDSLWGAKLRSSDLSTKDKLSDAVLRKAWVLLLGLPDMQTFKKYAAQAWDNFEKQLEITWQQLQNAQKMEAKEQIEKAKAAIPETMSHAIENFDKIDDLYTHLVWLGWDKQNPPDFATIKANNFQDYKAESQEAWHNFEAAVEAAWKDIEAGKRKNAEQKMREGIAKATEYLHSNFLNKEQAAQSIKKFDIKSNGDLIKKAFQAGWGTQYDLQPFAKFTTANEFIQFIRKEASKDQHLKTEWGNLETEFYKAWEMIQSKKKPAKT